MPLPEQTGCEKTVSRMKRCVDPRRLESERGVCNGTLWPVLVLRDGTRTTLCVQSYVFETRADSPYQSGEFRQELEGVVAINPLQRLRSEAAVPEASDVCGRA